MMLAITAIEVEKNLQTYHTVFLICLIAAICFLLVAIALFFILNIPNVFMKITGISRKKEIKQLDDNAAYTSQLTNLKKSSKVSEPPRRKQRQEMYSASGKLNIREGSVPVTQIDRTAAYADPRSETTLLSNSPEESIGTTVLSNDISEQETSLLSGSEIYQRVSPQDFRFHLSREIMLVHTDEDII